jgi:hypothetical protein
VFTPMVLTDAGAKLRWKFRQCYRDPE